MKFGINRISYFTGSATDLCLFALILYCLIWNHTVDHITGGNHSPYLLTTGCSDYISPLLCFGFNKPVDFLIDPKEQAFSLESKEICSKWFGISVPMTWKVLTAKSRKILYQSEIISAMDPMMHNLLINPLSYIDFKTLPAWMHPDDLPPLYLTLPKVPDASTSPAVVFFHHHGEKSYALTASPSMHKYRTMMKDENGNN